MAKKAATRRTRPRYQIEYERGRWGMSDGSKGVGGCRTPFGAWLALRRWQRTPTPPESSR